MRAVVAACADLFVAAFGYARLARRGRSAPFALTKEVLSQRVCSVVLAWTIIGIALDTALTILRDGGFEASALLARAGVLAVLSILPYMLQTGLLSWKTLAQVTIVALLLSPFAEHQMADPIVIVVPTLLILIMGISSGSFVTAAFLLIMIFAFVHRAPACEDTCRNLLGRLIVVSDLTALISRLFVQMSLFAVSRAVVYEMCKASHAVLHATKLVETFDVAEIALQEELSPPVASIHAAALALREATTAPEEEELLRVILWTTDYVASLSTRGMLMARSASPKPVLTPFNLFVVVENATRLLGTVADAARLPLAVRVSSEVQYVRGDPVAVQHALITLAGVCIQHSVGGLITVSAVCTDMYASTNTIAVEFSVMATRCRIGPELQPNVRARLESVNSLLRTIGATVSSEEYDLMGTTFRFTLSLYVCTRAEYEPILAEEDDVASLLTSLNKHHSVVSSTNSNSPDRTNANTPSLQRRDTPSSLHVPGDTQSSASLPGSPRRHSAIERQLSQPNVEASSQLTPAAASGPPQPSIQADMVPAEGLFLDGSVATALGLPLTDSVMPTTRRRLTTRARRHPLSTDSLRQVPDSSLGSAALCLRCKLPRGFASFSGSMVSSSSVFFSSSGTGPLGMAVCKCNSLELGLCRVLYLVEPGSEDGAVFIQIARQWRCTLNCVAPNIVLGSDRGAHGMLPHVVEPQDHQRIKELLSDYHVVCVDDQADQLLALLSVYEYIHSEGSPQDRLPPILYLTAAAEMLHVRRIVPEHQHGWLIFVTKPVGPLKVLRALRNAVNDE